MYETLDGVGKRTPIVCWSNGDPTMYVETERASRFLRWLVQMRPARIRKGLWAEEAWRPAATEESVRRQSQIDVSNAAMDQLCRMAYHRLLASVTKIVIHKLSGCIGRWIGKNWRRSCYDEDDNRWSCGIVAFGSCCGTYPCFLMTTLALAWILKDGFSVEDMLNHNNRSVVDGWFIRSCDVRWGWNGCTIRTVSYHLTVLNEYFNSNSSIHTKHKSERSRTFRATINNSPYCHRNEWNEMQQENIIIVLVIILLRC